MKKNWQDCKKILIIRLDNMGDLLMSTPAIRAIKEFTGCAVTVLTSPMAEGIVPYIDIIDEKIIAGVPWVKSDHYSGPETWTETVEAIKKHNFDGAIIFTVFSQNPMPAILLAWLAGIPNRLAYCRENPYHLLTDWVPDKEPFDLIRHQVERDLYLVSTIGALAQDESLTLSVPKSAYFSINEKLTRANVNPHKPWIIVHPGASERKREYPLHLFTTLLQKLLNETGTQILVTGTSGEKKLTETLCALVNDRRCKSLAGLFSLEEFMALIAIAPLVVSVNTGTVHIAASLNIPVAVLYAATNPQHTPWKVQHKVFFFPVENDLQSKNEILKYVQSIMGEYPMPDPVEIAGSIIELLKTTVEQSA